MRKQLLFFLFLLLMQTMSANTQVFQNNDQRWEVTKIVSNSQYTTLYCDIFILSNAAGCFDEHKDDKSSAIYLYGSWGRCKLVDSEYRGEYTAYAFTRGGIPDKSYYCKHNKGLVAHGILYFTRIPAGISTVHLHFDGGWANESAPCDEYHCPVFNAHDLAVTDNPNTTHNTGFTNSTLREEWENGQTLPIEGIYKFLATSNQIYWGNIRHEIAIKKTDKEYLIIYLGGANTDVWTEGELKGKMIPTTTPGIYKITEWYIENKMLASADFYLKYEANHISLYDAKEDVETQFMKLYPIHEIEETSIAPSVQQGTTHNPPAGNGTGFFVGSNVIATNHHVIKGAKRIEVVVNKGNKIERYDANVLTSDKSNDLALIQILDPKFQPLVMLPYEIALRSSEVGTSIFTMGFPMEDIMGSEIKITDGIISSKTGFQGDIATYQISAPIQPGNSGGPMFSTNGALVGMTSSGIPTAENVGYAIKSSYIHNLIDASPVEIKNISKNQLTGKTLTEQISILTPYVVLIYIY